MSKFKLTQTATEVQDILNNSLQKPTGLSKTKLVGVGVNGQENIEIGDNLTLANGKLSATGGGGGGSATARHCYSVAVDEQFIYVVNTEKNYNFTIGKRMTVRDFMINPEYEELHAGGRKSFSDYRLYPATGTYKGSDGALRVVKYLCIFDDNNCTIQGTSLDSSITTIGVSINLSNIATFSIVQLY